jgi:membrane-bound lytic murein transglycosylase B
MTPVPRPRRRWPIALGVLVPVAALVAGLGLWLHNDPPAAAARPAPPAFTIPYLAVASGSAIPAVPPPVPVPTAARTRWLTRVSAATDIPTRALAAYVRAAARTAVRMPSCHLTWATLAGIGRIESDHGQHHGDAVGADGVEATPIIGPALDGSPGVQRIPDTDHGTLDGDPVWDHAIGPMQFLPSRWRALGERASGDGRPADPQNIDDAALTAADYLCATGDLAVPARWWAAVFHYNNSLDYGRAVFSAAQAYARAG